METISDKDGGRTLVLASIGHFVNDGSTFFVPVIAALLALQPGVQATDVGGMLVVFYASSVVASVYLGRMADRTGRPGPMIGIGLALLSFGLIGFALSLALATGSALVLFSAVSALVAGIGSAFFHPLSATILRSSHPDGSRGKVLGIAGAVGSVGRMLYPALFTVFAVALTQEGSIALFGLIGLILSSVVWLGLRRTRLPPTPKDSSSKGKLNRGLAALSVVALVRGMAEVGIVAWVPTFIGVTKGAGVTDTGIAVTIMYSAGIIGQPLFGILSDRFQERLILSITSFGAAIFILAFVYATGLWVLAFLFAFGLFSLNSYVLMLSAAGDYAKVGSGSTENALVWGIGTTVGAALGPSLVGLIILNDYTRLSIALPVMAAISIVAGVLALLLPRPSMRRGGRAKVPRS
ncbi:MAG: MFS transporter [Methanomassiliicoccales archaeon]|nr:MFS transporter [Methanomassiliicoccales archaeon]